MVIGPHNYSQDLYSQLTLDNSRREIRILTIHDGPRNSLVQCSLRTISLFDKSTCFNALSYSWGGPSRTTTIIVNGLSVTVTVSLEAALRNLGNHSSDANFLNHPTLPIWIDALCINQRDTGERTGQVQIMDEIYSAANNVIVWLGTGTKYSDYAFDMMNSDQFRERLWELAFSGRQPCEDEIMLDVVFKHDLCKRDWWQRLWVRQEFILATNEPIICCGSRAVLWDHLISCFASLPRLWTYPDSAKVWEECVNNISSAFTRASENVGIHPMSLDRVRSSFRDQRALSLCDAIRYVLRNSAATNPRDFIYGLLGLLDRRERERITVDYELEPMKIYHQVANLLWKEHPARTLSDLLPIFGFRRAEDGVPSWVPDFGGQQIRGWQDHKTMRADRPWRQQDGILLDGSHDVLVLRGVLFDTVDTVLDAPNEFDDIHDIVPFLQTAEALLSEAINRTIQRGHPLYLLQELKYQETILETLTKSAVSSTDLFPGFSDEDIWDLLLGTKIITAGEDESLLADANMKSQLFARLSTMIRGKTAGRRVLATKAGFVGVGIPHVEARDVIALIFGASAPLVMRQVGPAFHIVGSAYVSGLMDPDLLDQYFGQMKHREMSFNVV